MATILGTSAGDTLNGTAGADSIYGFAGADMLFGGAQDDVIAGGASNDTITGGTGADTLYGGAGDDLFVVNEGELQAGEVYEGGTGFDTVDFVDDAGDLNSASFGSIEKLRAGFVDIITGNELVGFSELDIGTLSNETSAPITFQDGATISIGSIQAGLVGIVVDLSNTLGSVGFIQGGDGDDVVITNDAPQELYGYGGDDSITAGSGGDFLSGGAGRDTLRGGAGNDGFSEDGLGSYGRGDVIDGGAGHDVVSAVNSGVNLSQVKVVSIEEVSAFDPVTLTAKQASQIETISCRFLNITDGGAVDVTGDKLVGGTVVGLSARGNALDASDGPAFEIYGNKAADTIVAGDFDDVLSGGGGNDSISGNGGDDSITGGTGVDTVVGGAGDDTFAIAANSEFKASESYLGGAGRDTLSFDTLELALIDISGGTGMIDVETLTSVAVGFTMTAAQLDGFQSVTAPRVTLATAGTVDLSGGFVTATIVLSDAGNTLNLRDADGSVTVTGGAAADTVVATAGEDRVDGGGGNDTLDGGESDDRLLGGAGSDSFVFSSALNSANVDDLHDFQSGTDRIVLDHAIFKTLPLGALSAANFQAVDTPSATSSAKLIYDTDDALLYFNGNGSAAGGLQLFADLSASPSAPVADDFLVI